MEILRTIDIDGVVYQLGDNIEPLMAEIETLKALVDKLDKQLNPRIKVWTIRDNADIAYTPMMVGVDFVSNGKRFNGIQIGDLGNSYGDPHLVYLRNGEWSVYVDGMGTPADGDYHTIKILPTQTLPEEFVAWLEANADFIGEEPYDESEYPEMIFFAINNYMYEETLSFTCPNGMTWGELRGSEYTVPHMSSIHGSNPYMHISNITFDDMGMYVYLGDGDAQWMTYLFESIFEDTVIISGETYTGNEV